MKGILHLIKPSYDRCHRTQLDRKLASQGVGHLIAIFDLFNLRDDRHHQEPELLNVFSIVNGLKLRIPHYQCRKVFKPSASHGEGPHWSRILGKLFWVDIEGKSIFCGNPLTEIVEDFHFSKKVTCVVTCANPDQLVISLTDTVARFSMSAGTLINQNLLSGMDSETRFNDGKTAPDGTLIIGTMSPKPKEANLYRFDFESKFTNILKGVSVSNGLDWWEDIFLYIDSPTKQLAHFHWPPSPALDGLDLLRVSLDGLSRDEVPDGMCLDVDGNPWIAIWGGGRVSRFNRYTGKETARVSVPCSFVSSCCFGGREVDQLFITTARHDDKSILAGSVFTVDLSDLTKGFPPFQGREDSKFSSVPGKFIN